MEPGSHIGWCDEPSMAVPIPPPGLSTIEISIRISVCSGSSGRMILWGRFTVVINVNVESSKTCDVLVKMVGSCHILKINRSVIWVRVGTWSGRRGRGKDFVIWAGSEHLDKVLGGPELLIAKRRRHEIDGNLHTPAAGTASHILTNSNQVG